jgi:penicillin-binding protein 1A
MEGKQRRATLEQDSGAEGALMAMDNSTGDILAMVGGRDYALSQFNRATQAERQTGSSFKPYVYTAAIEAGVKPTDIIVDGPVSFGGYTPHNYENDYKGAMTITNAFAESRNIPALKLAARVGIHKVIDLAHRFGVTSNIPAYLPVALGAAEITLDEQVASYSVFPNDGIRVTPRMVRKVSNADGITLWEDAPTVNEVIDQQTARTMMTLLRAVTSIGTGGAAKQLNHPLGGKTGTTSDYTDAWFLGFSPSVTCGVWVGYDSRQSLGEKETGAKAALPIWMTFMKAAIAGKDSEQFLSDAEDGTTLKAVAEPPAAPGAVHPAVAIPAAIKTVKPSAAPTHPIVAPAGISEEDLPAKPALKQQPRPVTGVLPPKSQVKPALAPKAAPAKPTALQRKQSSKPPKPTLSAQLGTR